MNFTFLWYEFDSFFEFREAFQGMQPINQLLMFIGLVALTIACIALVYHVIRLSFILVYEIFKAIFNLFRSIIDSIGHHSRIDYNTKERYRERRKQRNEMKKRRYHYRHERYHQKLERNRHRRYNKNAVKTKKISGNTQAQAQTQAQTQAQAQIPDRTTMRPEPKSLEEVSYLHCPMCGEKFTDEMMGLLEKNNKVFCEYCGHLLEYVMQ